MKLLKEILGMFGAFLFVIGTFVFGLYGFGAAMFYAQAAFGFLGALVVFTVFLSVVMTIVYFKDKFS